MKLQELKWQVIFFEPFDNQLWTWEAKEVSSVESNSQLRIRTDKYFDSKALAIDNFEGFAGINEIRKYTFVTRLQTIRDKIKWIRGRLLWTYWNDNGITITIAEGKFKKLFKGLYWRTK